MSVQGTIIHWLVIHELWELISQRCGISVPIINRPLKSETVRVRCKHFQPKGSLSQRESACVEPQGLLNNLQNVCPTKHLCAIHLSLTYVDLCTMSYYLAFILHARLIKW